MNVSQAARSALLNFILAGIKGHSDACQRKQIILTSIFSLTCFVFLTLYGLQGLGRSMHFHASFILGLALLNALNYVYLRLTGNCALTCNVIVYLMMILSFYLLATGGIHNTGPLWLFVMPMLILYVQGFKTGGYTLVFLLTGCALLLFLPNTPLLFTEYDPEFTKRFFSALFSVTILSAAYEYTRQDDRRELLELSKKLDQMSRTDELTGLPNRRDMSERLAHEMARHERNHLPFSILVADIDHFKKVNDQHGHDCGDHALKIVATVLRSSVKKRDIVARWGGEEFLILLPETDRESAMKAAERLRHSFENLCVVNWAGDCVRLTMSIGVEACNGENNLRDCIRKADAKLFEAKRAGRNRVM